MFYKRLNFRFVSIGGGSDRGYNRAGSFRYAFIETNIYWVVDGGIVLFVFNKDITAVDCESERVFLEKVS